MGPTLNVNNCAPHPPGLLCGAENVAITERYISYEIKFSTARIDLPRICQTKIYV